MLKGEHGIGENVRELKRNGLSEREAVLVSMKNSKKDKEKSKEVLPSPSSSEDYPYGLRIDLSNDSLDKLGIEELPEVGDELELVAKVKVQSVSQDSFEGREKNRRVCLQITKMKLE